MNYLEKSLNVFPVYPEIIIEHMFVGGVAINVQAFGGAWTLLKLEVLEKYLNFYITGVMQFQDKTPNSIT